VPLRLCGFLCVPSFNLFNPFNSFNLRFAFAAPRLCRLSPMPNKVTIGLIQTACSPDPAANLKKTLAAAQRAAKQGAQIICTQELFRSQYFCQAEDHKYFQLAEPIPGPTTEAFQKLARDRKVVIIASPFEKR